MTQPSRGREDLNRARHVSSSGREKSTRGKYNLATDETRKYTNYILLRRQARNFRGSIH